MKINNARQALFYLTMVLVTGCLDPYTPKTSTVNVNYLVVDGFLNQNGPTVIHLSRTTPIVSDSLATPELNALVQMEGNDGTLFTLTGDAFGDYSLAPVVLDTALQFRIKIKTGDQFEYQSDYVKVKAAPPIDSLRYSVSGNNVQLYVSAHDDRNATRYYLWKFVETWQYNSKYTSAYVFDNGVVTPRPFRYDIYFCWKSANSTQIMTTSTAKLGNDILYDYPLYQFDLNSFKLQTKYSALVEQYALTEEAYNYWQQLKKSTEAIGTIFDPLPSQAVTNLHCVTNPSQPVVGYFSVTSMQQKRIFIASDHLPDVIRITGYEDCTLGFLPLANVPNFDGSELIFDAVSSRATLLGYSISQPFCVDCRLNGGTTTKPDFWQ